MKHDCRPYSAHDGSTALLFCSTLNSHERATKKLFTYSAVENERLSPYSFLQVSDEADAVHDYYRKAPMNKPTAVKSSNSAPRPPATKKAFSSKPNQGIIALQQREAPKSPQSAPSAKSTVPNRTSTPWTVEAASRIYRTTAQKNNGQVPKGSLGAKAMSAATKGASHLKSREK